MQQQTQQSATDMLSPKGTIQDESGLAHYTITPQSEENS